MSKAKPQPKSNLPTNSIPAISVEFLPGERPAVRSVDLALHFGLKHKNVLQDIKNLVAKTPESFNGLNFQPVTYRDEKNEERPCFLLTRDAFTLLVMGWTSPRAIEWKLRYIEAFNSLERAALENARLAGVAQGAKAVSSVKPEVMERLRKVKRYRSLGLTYPEIGKLLGVPKSTVAHWLNTAKKSGLLEAV